MASALPNPKPHFGGIGGITCRSASGYEPCSATNCANRLASAVDYAAIDRLMVGFSFGESDPKEKSTSCSSPLDSSDNDLSISTGATGWGRGAFAASRQALVTLLVQSSRTPVTPDPRLTPLPIPLSQRRLVRMMMMLSRMTQFR